MPMARYSHLEGVACIEIRHSDKVKTLRVGVVGILFLFHFEISLSFSGPIAFKQRLIFPSFFINFHLVPLFKK